MRKSPWMTLDQLVDIAMGLLFESEPATAEDLRITRAAVHATYAQRVEKWPPGMLRALRPNEARDALRAGMQRWRPRKEAGAATVDRA